MKSFFLNHLLPVTLGIILLFTLYNSCTPEDTETTPPCARTFYLEGYLDGNGNDCFFGIHVYKKINGFWIYQFPLFNESPFQAPVEYDEEWRWDVGFCDGATECVYFYLYEEDCENPGDQQAEFTWIGCPPSNPGDKLVIEKHLLDYQAHKVCDLCPD